MTVSPAARFDIAGRIAAATVGAYGLAAAVSCLSVLLPFERVEASLAGMMVAILAAAGAVVWAFAARSLVRAWLFIAGPGVLLSVSSLIAGGP